MMRMTVRFWTTFENDDIEVLDYLVENVQNMTVIILW
jgi:hypothetical protein